MFWDLETSHNLVASFTLRPEYINYENIIKERSIICASWKFMGEDEIYSVSVTDDIKAFRKDRHNDKKVLLKLKKAIESADALVAHNGDRFDLKYFNTRLLYHNIDPIDKPLTIDTLKVARRNFNFNSNRLDYIGQYLGCGKKIKTSNPMWLCIVNSSVPVKEALKLTAEMVKYNRQDVLLLEKVFYALRPYITNLPNQNLYHDSPICLCPTCGSDNIARAGTRKTKTAVYQRLRCSGCATHFRDSRTLETTQYK